MRPAAALLKVKLPKKIKNSFRNNKIDLFSLSCIEMFLDVAHPRNFSLNSRKTPVFVKFHFQNNMP